ncbi:cyclin-dependent kinase 4 inhibitor C [Anguilla anguilla]|uniref:cyclin-dependent kinase 4 inhibitor C n=1 Tax=Anguilla anguilla TaxID=7936 RepID=UPI0015AB3A47|nr:cyclin-dependent kinase 4 inhibitor C [Anguilla anguilla]XP_035268344.1 cyclin-dependent kinase 4 inhibitor C [Anguilla anguilla]
MADPSGANRLTSASARGDLTELQVFLQNGADVNERNEFGRTALQVMKLGNPAIALALLQAKADPNVRDPVGGLTVLHDAARDGYADTLQVLVNHGADVNIQDNEGNLPLHLAAREGNLDVVELLIQPTAEPMRRNRGGHTAYDLAIMRSRVSTAQRIQAYMHSIE